MHRMNRIERNHLVYPAYPVGFPARKDSMKIDHYALEVSDLEAAIRFYVDNFGFKAHIKLVDENEHESLAVLEMDGGKLELIQALAENNQPQPFTPPTLSPGRPSGARPHFCPHLALQTDSLDQILALIKERGLALVHGPLEIPGTAKWLYITDPDQNVIEFFQDLQ